MMAELQIHSCVHEHSYSICCGKGFLLRAIEIFLHVGECTEISVCVCVCVCVCMRVFCVGFTVPDHLSL